ncbi:MAG TPA: protease pro-enzyme activation domain-containing protein, partial [Pseudonocardiaceae bacterium]
MRFLVAAMAPVPIVAGIVLAPPANASTSAQSMIAMPHNVNAAISRSTRMGDLTDSTMMSVAVSLKLRNAAGLRTFLTAVSDPKSPQYRHYLTPALFAAKYGPTAADVASVTRYLTAQGLRVRDVSANRQVVDVNGSAAQIKQAFHTGIGTYRQGTRRFYANDTAPALPATVARVVSGISGLDNHAVRHTLATRMSAPAKVTPHQTAGGFTPSQLQTAYNTTSLGSA